MIRAQCSPYLWGLYNTLTRQLQFTAFILVYKSLVMLSFTSLYPIKPQGKCNVINGIQYSEMANRSYVISLWIFVLHDSIKAFIALMRLICSAQVLNLVLNFKCSLIHLKYLFFLFYDALLCHITNRPQREFISYHFGYDKYGKLNFQVMIRIRWYIYNTNIWRLFTNRHIRKLIF